MKNYTTSIYLFFISKNHGIDGKFQDMLFNFHRMVSIQNLLYWDRIFVFEEQKVSDRYTEKALTTLLFHGFIDADFMITPKGERFLEEQLSINPDLVRAFHYFEKHYKGEYAIEKGCFVSIDHFPTACHLCTNRVCEKNQGIFSCFTSLVKPFKNPYRSYSKTS